MLDKLGSIGFYTLTDKRAKNVTSELPRLKGMASYRLGR